MTMDCFYQTPDDNGLFLSNPRWQWIVFIKPQMTMDCFYQTPDDNGLKSISCTFYCETCLNGTHFGTTYFSRINSCSDYTGYIWKNFTCWDFICFFDSNRIALFSGVLLQRGLTVSHFIDVKSKKKKTTFHLFRAYNV
jgi:hypothetical protein